jgi:hypothetical protein
MSTNLRPFYFNVVLWGERFRNYFTEYCIPSLLAPNNLPALINKTANQFLICTLKEDWEALNKNESFKALSHYVTPIFMEIPAPKPGRSGCQHMGIGHKMATERCFQDKAYGIFLTPDLILSDGTLAAVQKHALAGYHVVYCAALRFTEEPLFQGLRDLNIYDPKDNQDQYHKSLNATGRDLVKIGVPAFHSQTLTYDFGAPYFAPAAPAAYWRIPEDGGVLLHCLSWCPMLLDYSIVKQHCTKALEEWTMEGDYVARNFLHSDEIYICTDSDEMMMISWAPADYQPLPLNSDFLRRNSNWLCNWINGIFVRATLEHPMYDPMKVKIFPTPVFWHVKDLTPTWFKLEKKIQKIINRKSRWDGKLYNCLYYCSIRKPLLYFYEYSRVIVLALFGNPKAWRQITRRLGIIFSTVKRALQN